MLYDFSLISAGSFLTGALTDDLLPHFPPSWTASGGQSQVDVDVAIETEGCEPPATEEGCEPVATEEGCEPPATEEEGCQPPATEEEGCQPHTQNNCASAPPQCPAFTICEDCGSNFSPEHGGCGQFYIEPVKPQRALAFF